MNPSERIDLLIVGLTDWRGKTLASIRKSIVEADQGIIEEWKWMGSPVWSRDGMIAVANAHKDKVKVTFSNGASLPDPDELFNAGLGGNKWRAIDLSEGDKINEHALKSLAARPLLTIRANRKAKLLRALGRKYIKAKSDETAGVAKSFLKLLLPAGRLGRRWRSQRVVSLARSHDWPKGENSADDPNAVARARLHAVVYGLALRG